MAGRPPSTGGAPPPVAAGALAGMDDDVMTLGRGSRVWYREDATTWTLAELRDAPVPPPPDAARKKGAGPPPPAAGITLLSGPKSGKPVEVGLLAELGPARDVGVIGNLAWVAARQQGLHLISVADPTQPALLSTWQTETAVTSVAGTGRFLYVAEEGRGVVVLDIADPSAPRRVGGNSAVPAVVLGDGTSETYAGTSDGELVVLGFHRPELRLDIRMPSVAGNARLRLDGPQGALIRLQRGPEPGIWADWTSVSLGDMPLEIDDPESAGSASGVYRAVQDAP